MHRLHRFAIDHPARTLAAGLLLFLAIAPGLLKLRISTDGRALVPADAPALIEDRAIREEFGVLDPIVVEVESSGAQGIYNAHTLALVADVSRELAQIPGVHPSDVLGLATEPGDHVRPGSFELLPWLVPLPTTEAEIAALRKGLERTNIYRGTLLSNDTPASATVILVGVPEGVDRQALCARIQDVVRRPALQGEEIHVVGAAVVESQLGAHLLDDLARLVPIAFLLMGAIFYASFRSWTAVLLAVCGVGVSLVCTLALMGWVGAPVYLTILVVPVILTTVGVADAIHILDSYVHQLRAGGGTDARAALERAMDEMCRPVVNTTVTTAIGFLSFAFSPIAAVSLFGVFMAVGVMACLVFSLAGIPAVLAVLGPSSFRTAVARLASPTGSPRPLLGQGLARGLIRRRALVLAGTGLVALAAGVLAARVEVQDSWIEGFSRESELFRATARVDRLFGGTHLLRLRLSAGAPRLTRRVARSAFDGTSLLLEGALADPSSSLACDRLIVRTIGDPPADGGVKLPPLELVVTEAAQAPGGTRLMLAHPMMSAVSIRDLLPSGMEELEVTLTTEKKLQEIPMLDRIRDLESFLETRAENGVGRVIGPWLHLVNVGTLVGGAPEVQSDYLHTRKGLSRILEMYERGRGKARLREIFDESYEHALVTVLLRDANFVSVSRLLDDIRSYEREHLAPSGIRITLGGDIALSQAMIGGIVSTQSSSLALSFAGILIISWIMTRSFVFGFLCAVPCALAVLLVFGLMAILHMPLGVATSMFAAMTIGIGDDYAIHLVDRFRRRRDAGSSDESIVAATLESAPAIVIDALSVGAGFSILILSSVPTNARLGILLVASIAACLAATLLVLPALLSAIRSRRPAR